MSLNNVAPTNFIIELCDSNGSPREHFNPTDYHFIIRSNTGATFSELLGTEYNFINDAVLGDSMDIPSSDSTDYHLCLYGLGFALGSGNPGDQWTANCSPPNTFWGIEPSNYQVVGLMDGGGFELGGQPSPVQPNLQEHGTTNCWSIPYYFRQQSGNVTVTHDLYLQSYQDLNFENYAPIPHGMISEHEGTFSDSSLTALKVNIGDLRIFLDNVFLEDKIDFNQSLYTTGGWNYFCSTNDATYNTNVMEQISSTGSWGDYPPISQGENSSVDYELIEGNNILFGHHLNFIKSMGGTNYNFNVSNFGNTNHTGQTSTAGAGAKIRLIEVPFITNTISYPDPVFSVTDLVVDISQNTVDQGGSVTGTVGFNVSPDFTGSVEVYIFDSNDLVENGGDLDEGSLTTLLIDGVTDLADLGVVNFDNENSGNGWGTLITEVSSNNYISTQFQYIANNTEALESQIDSFSAYVLLTSFDGSGLEDQGQANHWSDIFSGMGFEGLYFKSGQQTVISVNAYDPPIVGCMDDGLTEGMPGQDENLGEATNYDPEAEIHAQYMCEYEAIISGCTDNSASNYNPDATVDDGSCEYNPVGLDYDPGTALITNPVDIAFHLTEQELRYNKSINANKIIEARENHSGWMFGFSINKEIDSKNLLQDIAQSTKYIPTFSNDTFSYTTVKDTYTGEEEISTIKADDVIKYQISRTDIDKIYTQVEVQYKYDHGLDNYLSTTGKLRINSEFFEGCYGVTMNVGEYEEGYYPDDPNQKTNYYGLEFDKLENKLFHEDTSLIFKSDYIRDNGTATKLAEHLLMWHCNQHNIIDMTLPLKYYNLEVGDLIEFDEMIMGKKLYGEKYVLDEVNDMPIRCGQYILPLFMVTDVTKTLKNVKIKVIQLHHLSKDDLVWDGESYSVLGEDFLLGDVNMDGTLNIQDVILSVTIILYSLIDYSFRADMNSDGLINIQDIIYLVNIILGNVA